MSINYNIENKCVKEIIENELSINGISEFFIQNRVKNFESIKNKKTKKDEFGQQKEITDYSGIRIIVHRLIDVRTCIEIIANRFIIDYKNSNFNPHSFVEDKEFGYRSSHLVIINNDLKTEVQIRTLAQHIWASTSHNLDYKSSIKDSIFPRKLFRLSGLLEQIDIIIEDLYETSPRKNQLNLKGLGQLDHYSLEYFLSRKERLFSLICVGFERKPNSKVGLGTSKWPFSMNILDGSNYMVLNNKGDLDIILIACKQLNIKTVENLRYFLEENKKHIRIITSTYQKSKVGIPVFITYTLRLFLFLVAFISESNLEELFSNKAHPEFIKNLKEFVQKCGLSNNLN